MRAVRRSAGKSARALIWLKWFIECQGAGVKETRVSEEKPGFFLETGFLKELLSRPSRPFAYYFFSASSFNLCSALGHIGLNISANSFVRPSRSTITSVPPFFCRNV